MATVFGEVAEAYDDVRPGYPDGLGPAILGYHGPVTSVLEIESRMSCEFSGSTT